ncbi:MAG: hypothetical protein OXS30_08050 [Chloroflexota bacterium]|nr:hypothetical protein [Chloroflexota bacterium]
MGYSLKEPDMCTPIFFGVHEHQQLVAVVDQLDLVMIQRRRDLREPPGHLVQERAIVGTRCRPTVGMQEPTQTAVQGLEFIAGEIPVFYDNSFPDGAGVWIENLSRRSGVEAWVDSFDIAKDVLGMPVRSVVLAELLSQGRVLGSIGNQGGERGQLQDRAQLKRDGLDCGLEIERLALPGQGVLNHLDPPLDLLHALGIASHVLGLGRGRSVRRFCCHCRASLDVQNTALCGPSSAHRGRRPRHDRQCELMPLTALLPLSGGEVHLR